MSTVVLVPGACHGGWWYDPVVASLAALRRDARAVTLSGLDPDAAPPRHPATLDDHVREVVAALDGLDDVVLVGHSYGGSVVTGAADAVADRVAALVYLDAFVPGDGESCWSMTTDEQRTWYVGGAARTGGFVDPLPFFDARARPHPLPTLVQASRLTGAWRRVPRKVHVAALDWPGESPFAATAARLGADPEFEVQRWDTRHDVLHDGPGRVVTLLTALG